MKRTLAVLILATLVAAACGTSSRRATLSTTTSLASNGQVGPPAPSSSSTPAASQSSGGPCVTSLPPGASAGNTVPGLSPIPSAGISPQGKIGTEPTVLLPPGSPPASLEGSDLIVGSGQVVTSSDTVTVQYVGCSWTDKVMFDASWSRGQPASFPLNGVIPGWSKGLVGMMVGGRRELIIPPSMAYGSSPPPGSTGIAPNDTLIFVVDLVSIGG